MLFRRNRHRNLEQDRCREQSSSGHEGIRVNEEAVRLAKEGVERLLGPEPWSHSQQKIYNRPEMRRLIGRRGDKSQRVMQ